jgi:hypothetical protein
MDPSARRHSLGLELYEEVHRLLRLGTPVEDVAGLHQMRRATDPVELVVHDACGLQVVDKPVIGAMDVADRHDTVDCVELAGNGLFEAFSRRQR